MKIPPGFAVLMITLLCTANLQCSKADGCSTGSGESTSSSDECKGASLPCLPLSTGSSCYSCRVKADGSCYGSASGAHLGCGYTIITNNGPIPTCAGFGCPKGCTCVPGENFGDPCTCSGTGC